MRVVVNGKPEDVADDSTVADLVRKFELSPRQVAVEVNRRLVPRDTYDRVALAGDDRVEIVTFVGGGSS